MPNFGYHLARAEAQAVRNAYAIGLRAIARSALRVPRELSFDVYAYSSESALPEQVASIRSFLTNAGRPRKFAVVSDGTHTPESVAVLESIDRAVSVVQSRGFLPDAPIAMRSYLTEHPTGKQLALIMSLPFDGPALYMDSDVLFFHGASSLQAVAAAETAPALYLADCQVSADERIFRSPAEREDPVNTGVLFLRKKLDWSQGIARFLELTDAPTFFTNQTITHLAMHANGARAFDPAAFVLQLDDQFLYRDRYAGARLALRHYVNPVRHKFWNTLWRSRR